MKRGSKLLSSSNSHTNQQQQPAKSDAAQPNLFPATGGTRWGILADGGFKILLGIAYVIACVPMSLALGVEIILTVATGMAVLSVGVAEIAFANARTPRSYLLSLGIYDGGWLIVSAVAVVSFFSGGPKMGSLWLGYQAIAAITLTAILFSPVGRVHRGVSRPRD